MPTSLIGAELRNVEDKVDYGLFNFIINQNHRQEFTQLNYKVDYREINSVVGGIKDFSKFINKILSVRIIVEGQEITPYKAAMHMGSYMMVSLSAEYKFLLSTGRVLTEELKKQL
jgi:hypothetical protein